MPMQKLSSHIRSKIDVELQDLFEPWEVSETFIPKRDNKTRGYVKDEPFEKKKIIEFNPNSRRHIEFCLTKKYGWKPKLLTPSRCMFGVNSTIAWLEATLVLVNIRLSFW